MNRALVTDYEYTDWDDTQLADTLYQVIVESRESRTTPSRVHA